MTDWVDLLDSVNQKYDPSGSSLTSDNVQAALDELDGKPAPPPDFSDVEFTTYAVFDAKEVANATINFTTGNKQEVDASVHPSVTVQSPVGHPGNFMLVILNSNLLTSITSAAEGPIRWEGGTAPSWMGASVLALYYDGSAWYGSAIVDVT